MGVGFCYWKVDKEEKGLEVGVRGKEEDGVLGTLK